MSSNEYQRTAMKILEELDPKEALSRALSLIN